MALDVVAFDGRFVESAARLLAAGHSVSGEHASALSLSDVAVARRLVETWHETGPAVAAVRDGTLVGFMAATLAKTPGHQLARIRIHQHAAASPGKREIYRRLYASLSERLIAVGGFEHTLTVTADHHDTLSCLFELGFGVDQIRGLRPPRPPTVTAQGIQVRQAHAEDIAELLTLTVELQQFHAEPPILRPALLDLQPINDTFRRSLTDEHRLLLVAEEHGHLTGMMQVDPDRHYRDTATIGIAAVTASARSRGTGTALLSGVVDWADKHGFQACGTEWSSANLVSDAFWRGHGFTPARYTLNRLIDARVTWANAHLSYRDFWPAP